MFVEGLYSSALGGDEGLRESMEHTLVLVLDLGGLPMHGDGSADHLRAEDLPQTLVTEAHAEQGDTSSEGADDLERDARVLGGPGAGGDDDALGLEGLDVAHGDGVVAHHLQLRALRAERLDEVEGERVEVIDEEDHRVAPLARRARSCERALFSVSLNSWRGCESCTMPPPTWA
ncbi:hypothetical protein MFUL124B02_09645 [Myxococcus fulvus 124B02]|nr:hypothetical protein MFUL124B02_09645 [Myxococcus fulvus 124B02]